MLAGAWPVQALFESQELKPDDPELLSSLLCTSTPSSSEVSLSNADSPSIGTGRGNLYLCSQSACDCLQVRKRTSHRMHVVIVAFLLSPADSDAHSTTSSASPAQSPCYSNQSDDGSDTEMSAGSSRTPVFSFLDLTYWKR